MELSQWPTRILVFSHSAVYLSLDTCIKGDAVVYFRLLTEHASLGVPLFGIGVLYSPICDLCDSGHVMACWTFRQVFWADIL